MNPLTRRLRAAVKHIPGAWVRVYRDGDIWAGSSRRTKAAVDEVKAALEAAGYQCQCNGSPGTEGEHIIEIAPIP